MSQMKVMLLAPQPFYQERGTPIAVNMVLKVLSERGDQVDVVTYHEGEDVVYEGHTMNRIMNIPLVHGIPPGFSWKKLVSDAFLFAKAIRMASRGGYHLVHAVEEAVLIALCLKWMFRIPYVYDMDSSFAQQMTEKYPPLSAISFLLNFLEKMAVKNARAVVPVCDALAAIAQKHEPQKVVILHDVSLLSESENPSREDLRAELGITGPMLMYVGNLEVYQGIDLLLESFALALKVTESADLVIIGGKPADIEKYRAKSNELGIRRRVHFLGPRPVEHLADYLAQADILVSPRIKGQNTPMKLYSYLHSGKPVLATDLETHTQVLTSYVAMIAKASPREFSDGMLQLISSQTIREQLGKAGKELIERYHTYDAFRETLNGLYDWLTGNTRVTIAT